MLYGKPYNWYAVNDPRGLAPAGWHVPSDAEWTELVNYLGGSNVAGGKLKETGHWNSPNTGATDEVGFHARPGGACFEGFEDKGEQGHWWNSTDEGSGFATNWIMYCYVASVGRDGAIKTLGQSVRCVKD